MMVGPVDPRCGAWKSLLWRWIVSKKEKKKQIMSIPGDISLNPKQSRFVCKSPKRRISTHRDSFAKVDLHAIPVELTLRVLLLIVVEFGWVSCTDLALTWTLPSRICCCGSTLVKINVSKSKRTLTIRIDRVFDTARLILTYIQMNTSGEVDSETDCCKNEEHTSAMERTRSCAWSDDVYVCQQWEVIL